MEASVLLRQLEALGITVTVDGDDLVLRPGHLVPDDLDPTIRECKSDLLRLLEAPSAREEPSPTTTIALDAALAINLAVGVEGICVFWAEALHCLVAFVQTEEQRALAPEGVPAFTVAELSLYLRPDGGQASAVGDAGGGPAHGCPRGGPASEWW